MAVLICGEYGSSGKKGCSPVCVSFIIAVATLAAGLDVVVMERAAARRVRGRSRAVHLNRDAMAILVVFRIGKWESSGSTREVPPTFTVGR